jgi:ATP-dependent DNA helicase DinG
VIAPPDATKPRDPIPLTLDPDAAARVRAEIERAGGREVCFLVEVTAARTLVNPRAVARGNHHAVLAAARDASAGEVLLHNHPSGVLEPSEADLALAARVYEDGLGTAITNNAASELYVVVEPPAPLARSALDLDDLDGFLAPGGRLEATHPGYEDRPGQRAMARAVGTRFNEGGVALLEAGTGTGKSMAYLLPAVRWALLNRERTVVSTNTINLQEQLTGKDLPLLRRVLGEPFTWALVKGRGNYISIRRLEVALESANTLFETDRSGELRALEGWIQTSRDGSLADLSSPPSEEVWDEVRSDGDVCLKARCPHFQSCFYQKARRQAAAADVLVVNHALLFSDLSVRRSTENWGISAVLPPYRHVILDEAHNVEDAATSHLGAELTRSGVHRVLTRLDRNGKGILKAVEDRLRGEGTPGALEVVTRMKRGLIPHLQRARDALSRYFDALEPFVPADDEEPLRLGKGDPRDPSADGELLERLDHLLGALTRVRREVEELRGALEAEPSRKERYEDRILDLSAVERRLESSMRALELVFDPPRDGDAFVRWVEGRGRRGELRRNVRLAAAPVEPGRLLRESLFERVETTILTSATLTAGGDDFAFLRERLGLGGVGAGSDRTVDPRSRALQLEAGLDPGLDPGLGAGFAAGFDAPSPVFSDPWGGDFSVEGGGAAESPLLLHEAQFPSPFDYPSQALFCVPTDLPEHREDAAFQRATADVTTSLARITDGGIFVLFTSHRALRTVAHLLREAGADREWPLWVHGEGGRDRLVRDFTRSGRGILLGTSSFWEGVDVPGDPLRGLIVQKIPFRVPTEPITQARTEALERRGRSGFGHYQLPLAALRLKQGFGRLIRRGEDRGAVLLLDGRILRASYGRRLRGALPPAPLVKGPWTEVHRALESFYGLPEQAPGG